MEELNKFLNLLKRNRLMLIIVPVCTVIITFFLVRNLPDSYIAQAQVATGIVDETKQGFDKEAPQAQQIVQEFSNLLALIKMKKILDQVSYQLLIHDLTSATPFKKASSLVSGLSDQQRKSTVRDFQVLYGKGQEINLFDKSQRKLHDLLVSMKYDSDYLKDKLQVYRTGDSDFITLQMDSESPELSVFVVNHTADEFIRSYTDAVKANQLKTTDFLRNLLAEKNDSLLNKMNSLRDYKVKNRVLNLDEQSKQLYSQIVDYNNQRQEAIQKTSSYAGALNEIDRKFEPGERRYIEATMSRINQSVVSTKEELSGLYDMYYKNDLDEKYKQSIDSLSHVLERQISKSSDAYITNPLNSKQSLIEQKLTLQIQMDISRYSINALERELATLNAQFDELVPREADVQRLGMDIDIATKEYLDILNKYNQSSLENAFDVRLNLVQPAMTGIPQPTKKMLLVLLSGVISAVFCVLIVFVIYYFDNSITTARELANSTGMPVLGTLYNFAINSLNLGEMWSNKNNLKPNTEFKRQLRSIRYEIEKEANPRIVVITSLDPGAGKSFLSLSLSFAWKMTNHRVLLIDGNFANPELSKASSDALFLEDYIRGDVEIDEGKLIAGSVSVLRNRGGDTALLELAAQEQIQKRIEQLNQMFDVIIVETSALDGMNQTREWMLFCGAIITVFKAGDSITEQRKGFISYLKGNDLFKGWVINKVSIRES